MEEIKCPNCQEKFKADMDKKYFDCPYCKFEFAERDLTKAPPMTNTQKTSSLLEKIKNAQKNN